MERIIDEYIINSTLGNYAGPRPALNEFFERVDAEIANKSVNERLQKIFGNDDPEIWEVIGRPEISDNSSDSKPIALKKDAVFTEMWVNEEKTMLAVDRLEDLPAPAYESIQFYLKKEVHIIDRQLPLPTLIYDNFTGDSFLVYRLSNKVLHAAAYEKCLVDAALMSTNPKMYLYYDNGPLFVEHDDGYFLISAVDLKIEKRVAYIPR